MLNYFNQYFEYVDLFGGSHPHSPKPNWNKYFGLLQNSSYHDEMGYKVYEENYEYELKGDIKNANTEKKITSLKYRLFDRPTGYGFSFTDGNYFTPNTGPTAWIWSFYDTYHTIGLMPTTVTKTSYFNNETESVVETSNMYYNFGNLLYKSSFEDSHGNLYETINRYANQFSNWNGATPLNVYAKMTDKNMLFNAVEVINKVNNNTLSARVNEYEEDNAIFSLKRSYSLEKDTHEYQYTQANAVPGSSQSSLNKDNRLVQKIINQRFDDQGNALQYTKDNDQTKVVLWGYNKTVPIAFVDGVTYDELDTWFFNDHNKHLSFISSLTDSDISSSLESVIRGWFANLNESIQTHGNVNIQLKYYTYDSLIGITSMTDSRGYTTFYEYDDQNRLLRIRDKTNFIIKEYDYNYAIKEDPDNSNVIPLEANGLSVITDNSSSPPNVIYSCSVLGLTGGEQPYTYQWSYRINSGPYQSFSTSTTPTMSYNINNAGNTFCQDYDPSDPTSNPNQITFKCVISDSDGHFTTQLESVNAICHNNHE